VNAFTPPNSGFLSQDGRIDGGWVMQERLEILDRIFCRQGMIWRLFREIILRENEMDCCTGHMRTGSAFTINKILEVDRRIKNGNV
jgi:hypothetical protein